MTVTKKTAGVLAAITGFSTIALGAVSVSAQTPPTGFGTHHGARERHPEIRAALRHLEQAKTALQNAKHDFTGHREKALDLTNQAISEAQQALQSDRN